MEYALEKAFGEDFMAEEQQIPALDENYADFIIQYNRDIHGPLEELSDDSFQVINDSYAVIYIPLEETAGMQVNAFSYNSIPKCYTHMVQESLIRTGITRLHNHPYLRLRGNGTAIAVIDSGIDYTHPAFLQNGRTKVAAIWDQTLDMAEGGTVPYGREFTREEIQQALEGEEPFSVVPSRDENGHGTFLAGIAAGSELPEEDFSGAAPEASLIIVKLKQAKRYLRSLYLLPEGVPVYQENDVMLGIWYATRKAQELNLPLSVSIGLGTSQGAHMGTSPLEQSMRNLNHVSRNIVSTAAGNEGNTRNHFMGILDENQRQIEVELRVGEGEPGFVTELWGISPGTYQLRIQSPTGEILPVSTARGNGRQTLSFIFVETRIEVSYVALERESGSSLFFIRFLQPTEGIWKFLVSGERQQEMYFHMWLPVQGFVSEDTFFLQPSPYTTITSPGNAEKVMTVTAYNERNDSLYLGASRGYSALGAVKPSLAAPGVDALGPDLRGGFTVKSGTSISTALCAGAAALLFEWAIVRENAVFLNGTSATNYLIRGTDKREGMEYPNPDWGYGTLNLYRVFQDWL